ncbi:MAG: hypothetical protein DIZ80_07160 [endosymbiont of Galathealinum brachiosum]|uniref:DUF3025 domain-containing protein n=1 Tax=endosymbiont of Galathealinum brachiosum TaxID=2200906 RepID=A0A370DG60_9GAMM|nr:MAG: hypothetical protein DIZ80_07160 [endosymbiont of Galathealinum brachiosum]
MTIKDQWNTSIFHSSPIIRQLQSLTNNFGQFNDWPTINEYSELFNKKDVGIKPVPQSTSINSFEDQYEPRVYLKNELQTRTYNWHDFFNALIWLKFPKTKKTLNKIHYKQAIKRPVGSNRSTLENRITQFDECGAIIITNNRKMLDLIKNHQWHELFISNQNEFENNLRCVIFGHAMFEKAINPYIGMTCHCILLEDQLLLDDINNDNYKDLDEKLANIWENQISSNPQKFNALPLLGIPGYWPVQNEDFYTNTNYFR